MEEGINTPTYFSFSTSEDVLTALQTVSKDSNIISDELSWNLNKYVYIILCGSISFFGVASNFCNLIIFYRLEVKDSMSVYLFGLSLTDFLVSWVILYTRVGYVRNIFYDGEGTDPLAFNYIGPSWAADILFLCSGWILAILSLERCICVILPFKVKYIFTKNRSIAAVVIIYVVNIFIHIPVFMTQKLQWVSSKVDTGNNSFLFTRRLVLALADNRETVQNNVGILTSTVIPIPSLAINVISALWMIYGLYTSSKIRRSMTVHQTGSQNHLDTQNAKVTAKTRKLMKVVLFLAMIFIICSVPRIIANSVNIILPHIAIVGSGKRVHVLLWQLSRLFAALNASTNIFVYLTINSSYRVKFKELFRCGSVK